MSLAQLKIPLFEWKNDPNVGSKSAEYYLNLYYYQLSNNSMNNNTNIKSRKKDSVNTKDESVTDATIYYNGRNTSSCENPIRYMIGVFKRSETDYYYASIEI